MLVGQGPEYQRLQMCSEQTCAHCQRDSVISSFRGSSVRVEEGEQAAQQLGGVRRAAADVQVDRHHLRDPAHDRVAAGEQAAVERAVADRHHPFGIGRGGVGALERLAHVLGHRAGDEQDVGMARRGDETDAEALEVVEGVIEGVDLQLATIAGAGIDLSDRETAAEPPARGTVECRCQLGDRAVVRHRWAFTQRRLEQAGQEQLAHQRAFRDRGPSRSS
jgi:hypothetical protein